MGATMGEIVRIKEQITGVPYREPGPDAGVVEVLIQATKWATEFPQFTAVVVLVGVDDEASKVFCASGWSDRAIYVELQLMLREIEDRFREDIPCPPTKPTG